MSALTLAKAKTYLSITDTAEDPAVQATVDAAEAAIAHWVGPLVAGTATEIVRPFNYDCLVVAERLPVRTLTSVTPRGGTAIDVTLLDVNLNAGIIRYAYGASLFTAPTYTVVYSGGLAATATAVPADLMLAVQELTRHLWTTRRGSGVRRPGSAAPDAQAALEGAAYALPRRVTELIAPYSSLGLG